MKYQSKLVFNFSIATAPCLKLLKSNPHFRDITWYVEENLILHEIFRVVSRFPRYISCYNVESWLPFVQCTTYSTLSTCTVVLDCTEEKFTKDIRRSIICIGHIRQLHSELFFYIASLLSKIFVLRSQYIHTYSSTV